MLAIGRALMTRPRLLLLDEPSLGLAPLLAREIFRVIRRINDDGVAVLLVEQNAGARSRWPPAATCSRPGASSRRAPVPSSRPIRVSAPPTSDSTASAATSRADALDSMAVSGSTIWQPELETLDREPLERLVVERMRATLARVLSEPAWARRLGGVRPGDIARVADWRALPFLTKDELRDAYPYGLACARPPATGASRCRAARPATRS